MSVYKNTKRKSGSQSETPSLKRVGKAYKIGGYQKFTITKHNLTAGGYSDKFNHVKKFLENNKTSCTTLSDIGASTGLVAFMAAQSGYKECHALDHDLECLHIITKIKSALGFTNVFEKMYSFGDETGPCDIVIMLALIHWIYSCTALYGSFDKIISYLRTITIKYLIIEWVDPTDPAIRLFKHIQFNKSVIKESYNKQNFLQTLKKYFASVTKVYNVNGTRELYLATV